jgi:serine/threonine protein kinase
MQLRLERSSLTLLLNGQPLARGGEATIYEVPRQPTLLAKVYHQPTQEHADKVAAMIAAPPTDPMAATGHVSIAWPLDRLLEASSPRFCGYIMRRVDKVQPIFEFYNPRSRLRFCPLFHFGYLLRTARNVAAAVRAIHERGYIIGDLNESNILVNNMALVTLVDTDSFQVPDKHQVHRCPVGKPEYTPPELQGALFADFDRGPEHDAFALAVLIFQLLMQGIHPFAGRFADEGEPGEMSERIAAGHWPYVRRRRVPYTPNPHAPPFDVLPPQVQDLMRRCFEDGHARSILRPDATAWLKALQESEKELVACPANPKQHVFHRHQKACPWCDLARRQGRDLFPSAEDVQAGRVGSRVTAVKPPEVIQVAMAPAPMSRDLMGEPVMVAAGVGSSPRAVPVPRPAPSGPRSRDLEAPVVAVPVAGSRATATLAAPSVRTAEETLAEPEPAPSRRRSPLIWVAGACSLVFLVTLILLVVILSGGKKDAGSGKDKTLAKKEPAEKGDKAFQLVEKRVPVEPPKALDDPKVLALVRNSVRDRNYTPTEVIGFPLHTAFEEIPPDGAILIGFEITLGKFTTNDIIQSVRPIFWTEKGEFLGQTHGKPSDRMVTVKAKKGYAVGAVSLITHLRIDGLKITFMKVDKKWLDPDQSYQSEDIASIGGNFGNGRTIGGSGALVIGICGKGTPDFCDALGLVLRGKVNK